MLLEDKIKQITLENIKEAYRFIVVKKNDKYYLYSDQGEKHRILFNNFKKIAGKYFRCKCGGMVLCSENRKELMLYGMCGYYGKFPKDIVKNLILEYVKDTDFKEYNIIVD